MAKPVDPFLSKTFLTHFETKQQLKDWVHVFLGLDLPDSYIDPDSNSSPIDWMFNTYQMYKNNEGNKNPNIIVVSSRESYKTLTESIWGIIGMVHFKATLAHMAAIVPQATAAQKYIQSFLQKIEVYLVHHNLNLHASNAKEISLKHPDGTVAYMKIIVCSLTGANCIAKDSVLWKSDGSKVLAKDVKKGDKLLTYDYMELCDAVVEVGHVGTTNKLSREVIFEDGSNLITSNDHRIFTDAGWKRAGILKLNQMVLTGGTAEIITSSDISNSKVIQRDINQLILGSLLGDSSITINPSKKTARFCYSHTEASQEYVDLKNKILQDAGFIVKTRYVYNKLSPNRQIMNVCATHPLLFELRQKYYTPNKKVTLEWLNQLTWEGVAYWFVDDVSGNGKIIGRKKDHCYRLASCGFDYEEHLLIQSWFAKKGFNSEIIITSNSSKKKYFSIEFSLDSSRDLYEFIAPYFVNCMRYKLVAPKEFLFSEAIDSDELVKKNDIKGFQYATVKFRHFIKKTRKGRVWLDKVKSKLTSRVVEIKELGYVDLIDIEIKTDKSHLRSFYANSMKLLHNSSHTNLMCVAGKTKLLIKTNDSVRDRVQATASSIYKRLFNGESIEMASFNHELGKMEFKQITKWFNNGERTLVDVILENGKVITTTPDHKYFNGLNYEEVQNLKGKSAYILNNKILKKITILDIVPANNRNVYDFTVEGNHNYFANGVLVHNCIDEIDTIRSQEGIRAYKEAQMIPGVFDGQFPMTIKTSTMKFPGGLFSKEMDLSKQKGWPIYRWNILDITEHCPKERCLPDAPKESVYVARNLPLRTISINDYRNLLDKEQEEFELIEQMKGCVKCSLGPVCRGRLHARNPADKGGLWKPIDFTITQFDKTDADMAEAQLLCWRPSSAGMVYPRFAPKDDGSGNTYTLKQAWEVFTGDVLPEGKRISHDQLVKEMIKHGVRFYAGVDWGFRHAFAIVIGAVLPNKEFWIIDAYSVSGLEFEQMMDLSMTVRDKYRPHSWFCDTAQPMFIKAFKKNKMPCPKFTKDVMGGISSIRGQIMNAKGKRFLKVIKSDRTEIALKMFAEHCFKLDTLGNITQDPDDGDFADFGDCLRYLGQNLFKPKGKAYIPPADLYEPTVASPIEEWRKLTRPTESIINTDLLLDFGADL